MAELQASLGNRRVVDNRQETSRIRHDQSVKQRFVVVEQVHEVNVATEVGAFVSELQQNPA